MDFGENVVSFMHSCANILVSLNTTDLAVCV